MTTLVFYKMKRRVRLEVLRDTKKLVVTQPFRSIKRAQEFATLKGFSK